MPWTERFIEDLQAQPADPIFLVHFTMPGGSAVVPGVDEITLSSSHEYGDVVGVGMDIQISGQSLRPVEWSYTAASASVTFVADSPNSLTHTVRRGQITKIMMGFPGYSTADFQPIFVGRLSSISGRGPNWNMSFEDGTTLLQQQLTGTATRRLFADADQSLTTNYTTIASSSYSAGDSTINVADNSKLRISAHSGAVGMVKIEPDSGDPFYVKYTGKGSGTITGAGSGVHDTTASSAAIGKKVWNVPLLNGTALTIYKRLLISDGTGVAADDPNVYPVEWGLGVPEEYVDIDDIDAQASVLITDGVTCSPEWKVLEVQSSPWPWLFGLFKELGLIPVMRQGQYTIRAIQKPSDATITSGITISDDEIIDYEWSAYHPDVQSSFLGVTVTTSNGSSTTSVMASTTFPVDYVLTYDLTDTTWAHSTSGQTKIRSNITGRCAQWGTFVPYALKLDCAGLRLAQLCPGDVVTVSLQDLDATNGYDEIYTGLVETAGWTNRSALVTAVSADFVAGLVSLELSVVPEFE